MTRDPESPGWSFEELCLVGLVFIACTSFAVMLLLPAMIEFRFSWRGVILAGVIGGVATAMIARKPAP